jgi:hypothetical protein
MDKLVSWLVVQQSCQLYDFPIASLPLLVAGGSEFLYKPQKNST